MFKVASKESTDRRWFSMKFENGYTISIAMGEGAYSTSAKKPEGVGSAHGNSINDKRFVSVEVAAWDDDGNWVELGDGNDVVGWQSADNVLAIMNKVAALPQVVKTEN